MKMERFLENLGQVFRLTNIMLSTPELTPLSRRLVMLIVKFVIHKNAKVFASASGFKGLENN